MKNDKIMRKKTMRTDLKCAISLTEVWEENMWAILKRVY